MAMEQYTKVLYRIILIVCTVFILHSSLFCEEDYFLKLDQLLIESSNKTIVKYEDLSENIRIIPVRFLQEYNIKTISDLIPYISSMYLSRYRSGEALVYTLGILNSHNEKILLLINGVPVYDPFYNKSVVDEYYLLDNVDHIEIAIGPYSSLYGTGTFAGYINIVEKKQFPNSVKLNGASTERFRSSYSFSGVIDGFEYRTAITHLEDKGIGTDVNYKDKPDLLEEDLKKNTLIRAGISFKDFNFSVINVNYRFNELNQEVYTWANASQNDIGWHIFKDILLTADYEYGFAENMSAEININHQIFSRDSLWGYTVYDSTTATYYYMNKAKKHSERSFGELKISNDFPFLKTLVAFYMEYNNLKDIRDYEYKDNSPELVEPSSYYLDPVAFNNYAAYIQMMLQNVDNIQIVGSVRYDYNHYFHDFLSPKLSLSYRLRPVTLYVNAGRAFRSPSPRELLLITTDWALANEELTPEIIDSVSVSLKWASNNFVLNATGFYMELSDLIELRAIDASHTGFFNIGHMYSRGITLYGEYQSRVFDTSLSLTYTDARVMKYDDLEEIEKSLFQYGYPLFKGVHLFKWHLTEYLAFSMANTYVGYRPRAQWNEDKPNGEPFLITDLNLTVYHDNIRFSIYAKNAFDIDYATMYYVDKVASSSYTEDLKMPGVVIGMEIKYEF